MADIFWPKITLNTEQGKPCELRVIFPETDEPTRFIMSPNKQQRKNPEGASPSRGSQTNEATTNESNVRRSVSDPPAHQPAEGELQETTTPTPEAPPTPWQKAAKYMMLLTFVGALSCFAVAIYHLVDMGSTKYVLAWSVAAFFVCISVPVAMHGIYLNMTHYRHSLQRHYIRILLMIPIFSIESWCALRFQSQTKVLETMREVYESYVIYSFFSLLRDFVGTTREEIVSKLKGLQTPEKKYAHHLRAVFWCLTDYLPKWELGEQFLHMTSIGVLQFVFVRAFFAVLVLTLENIRTSEPCYIVPYRRSAVNFDSLRRANTSVVNSTLDGEEICPNYFGAGDYRWNRLYVYEVLIVNLSQTWAMYNMILFYHETLNLIRPLRPLTKLLSVKGVVFVAFWQGCIIAGAVKAHVVTGYHVMSYSPEEVADALQNFLICIEMSVAAVLMHYAYSHKDFRQGGPLSRFIVMHEAKALKGIKEVIPDDFVHDSYELGAHMAHAVAGRLTHSRHEPTPPPPPPPPPPQTAPPPPDRDGGAGSWRPGDNRVAPAEL